MRQRKDKFEQVSYGFEPLTEHELVQVSVQSHSKITYEMKVSEDLDGKDLYATTDQTIRTLHYTDDQIKKLFREKGMIVTKIEKATIPLPNICVKCNKKGIPRIEKKSNKDYHYRVGTRSRKTDTNRPDEYWLVYDHQPKKCRIAQYDKNHFLFKNPKDKSINLQKHFFPRYLEKMKRELWSFNSFQKFINTSHA